MTRSYRRIITGHDAQGHSIVVSDGAAVNIAGMGGGEPSLVNFWTQGGPSTDSSDERVPLHPAPGGSTFRFFRIPPERDFAHLSPEQRMSGTAAYFQNVGAGDAHIPNQRHPAFHKTHSVDYIVLLEGEVSLLVDGGDYPMKPFDVVVQRGTSHSWVNNGEISALMMAVLIDDPEA